MKILVTGGTGFTGSALCKRLVLDGHDVTSLDTQPGMSGDELRAMGVRVIQGSVTDAQAVNRAAKGCRRIFHIAAAFRAVNAGRKVYHDVNVNGTRLVMEAALKNSVERVVYCSTQGVHGHIKHPPGNEMSPIAPADYYQQTKWEGELVAREFMDRGLWVSIVRPTAIYGPGDPERFYMIFKRVRKGRFVFLGDGTTHYHPVYIDNLVDGFILAADKEAARGQTYIIGDERSVSLRELVMRVGEALGNRVTSVYLPFWPAYLAAAAVELAYKPLPMDPPIFRRRVDWFRQNRSFNIRKASRELGYAPAIDLQTGLNRTGEWYRKQGML